MKASRWMALPLMFGLSALAVACDTAGEPAGESEVEGPVETDPTGAEADESEETEETEGAEGGDD
ncbi:hypothetical protein PGN35_009870 [Nodosilinea sp. PGN35]|uniref:hypothetical protein n=1 Tax=Nodosilinea sp. PGN35 TaxID=3020489 RepID=UPI0023B2F93A|nr:hypothetical protein [Nodosilinea sp. TSF1-S3]MDF0366663.1 hypothetical protein [Nodosilinea sp. TSF1-S3]